MPSVVEKRETTAGPAAADTFVFTSESVTEGHPDKVCDSIADAILDAHLSVDPATRINIEVLAKKDHVVLSGEITSHAKVDLDEVCRRTIRWLGYDNPAMAFNADKVNVLQLITKQAGEIDQGVSAGRTRHGEQGAGDQGMMFGYASSQTPQALPLPIMLAHGLTGRLAAARKSGAVPWMRPDGKAQVTVAYADGRPQRVTDVVVSVQHEPETRQDDIREFVAGRLLPEALGAWMHGDIRLKVNPTGSFAQGGPEVDSGLTGRKIIADTYGGWAHHGGGSFSGKDASKVDRSGAYFTRYVARKLVESGIAREAEIQVAYAIGEAEPVSIHVDVFGTGDRAAALAFVQSYDFRPSAIIEQLGLLRPIYSRTTNYGHFGKPDLPWER